MATVLVAPGSSIFLVQEIENNKMMIPDILKILFILKILKLISVSASFWFLIKVDRHARSGPR
jgi:hypothetical protein